MLKSLQTSANGLTTQLAKHEIVANNLSNSATTGFKRELARFSQEASGDGQVTVSSATDFVLGSMKRTGNPLDIAIEGEGFFVVQTDDGERYTRGGSFLLGDDGTLTTPGGHAVVGSSGPIQIEIGDGELAVSKEGSVSVGGESAGSLRIVRFDPAVRLIREGSNLYRAAGGGAAQDIGEEEVRVQSGFIEESNVNPLREMINMIAALRTFQLIEKSIQAADDVLDTMINQVGRAPSA